MDERPKCEAGVHQNPSGEKKNPRGEHRQQLLARHTSEGKGNKGKNELLGLHQDKKLLLSKGNSKQNQKTTCHWGEMMFVNVLSDNGQYLRSTKNLPNSTPKKQTIQSRNE